jgi:outer membrane protein OmpA-like peptidoglycan-associated protein
MNQHTTTINYHDDLDGKSAMNANRKAIKPLMQQPQARPLTYAVVAAISLAVSSSAMAQQKKNDDSLNSEARGRVTDSSQIDKRAVEINLKNTLPASSERMLPLPREFYILRGLPRELDSKETVTTIPGVVTPGSTTPGAYSSTPRFDSGEDILTPDYRAQLDDIISKVKGRSNLRFRLIGHTDVQRIKKELLPRFPDNMALGLSRAKIVGGYLKEKLGLADSAFTFDSRGPEEPVATPREDVKNWPMNRRVVVEVFYDDIVAGKSTPDKTERTVTLTDPTACRTLTTPEPATAGVPFRISIDGVPVDLKRNQHEADKERCIDVALEKANLRLQYDNLRYERSLNITPWPQAIMAGEAVTFTGWSNYRYYIKKAEVHIFNINAVKQAEPIAVVPVGANFEATWTPPKDLPDVIHYKLRVYDAKGNFDETLIMPLAVVKERKPTGEELTALKERVAGYGENRIDVQNISISGGTLTIHGGGIAKGERVLALGLETPVDDKGNFVMEQIVPRGFNTAEVAVVGTDNKSRVYRRNLELPRNDWFFVGIGDLTVGRNKVTGPAALLTGDTQHYDGDTYTDGRIAFFAKGNINNKWTFTGAVDTFNQPIRDIFKNFDYKDTRSLFNRIDPRDTWPVFGDDSTIAYDAPTQGKVFVRIDDGKSHAMWGNFKESLGETQLMQFNRSLYGANARYQSEATTSFGQRAIKIEGFAADPGTVAAREDFRGTGGSLYYLQRQDVTRGSERVRIEIRDRDSNLVMATRPLSGGVDYTVDYLQGRVLLTNPLASLADDSQLIRAGGLAGNPAFLVVDYEYTPLKLSSDSAVYGGRASAWLNDNIKLGITATKQQLVGGDQRVDGLDVTLRQTEGTFVKIEHGRSQGAGVGNTNSLDGGFNFSGQPQISAPNIKANASRVEGQATLKDLGLGNGRIAAYWQMRDAGYSAPGQLTDRKVNQFGLNAVLPVTDSIGLKLKLDDRNETNGTDTHATAVDIDFKLSQQWALAIGAKEDKRTQDPLLSTLLLPSVITSSAGQGKRTDIGARLDYTAEKDWGAYIFGQYTASKTGTRFDNDRLGIGGKYRISDKTNLLGEYSGGDGGSAGKFGVEYLMSSRTSTYINYQTNTNRGDDSIGARNGAFVVGGKSQFTDTLSMFTEHKYSVGELGGLTHVYGVNLVPRDKWTFGVTLENGYIGRESQTQIERKAAGLKLNYAGEDTKYASVLEWRRDESLAEERRTILWRNNLSYKANEDWRLLGRLDLSDSDSNKGAAFAANFRDIMLGFAYRPAKNDRWNTFVKLQYLYDLTSPAQLSSSAVPVEYAQKSKVFAIDTTYDLTQRWTIGGKVAMRTGELRASRDESQPWFKSKATLYALRADYKIVRNWDFLVEGRELRADESGRRSGYLGALYYHINENVKFGGGYNFADFTDDVTNLSYRSRGPFLNLIGKW